MFDLFTKLNPYYFLIAFAMGLLYFYIYNNNGKPKIIIKEPTPNDNTIYMDETDKYTFITKEIVCPAELS